MGKIVENHRKQGEKLTLKGKQCEKLIENHENELKIVWKLIKIVKKPVESDWKFGKNMTKRVNDAKIVLKSKQIAKKWVRINLKCEKKIVENQKKLN